jgi:hypothetical protein
LKNVEPGVGRPGNGQITKRSIFTIAPVLEIPHRTEQLVDLFLVKIV